MPRRTPKGPRPFSISLTACRAKKEKGRGRFGVRRGIAALGLFSEGRKRKTIQSGEAPPHSKWVPTGHLDLLDCVSCKKGKGAGALWSAARHRRLGFSVFNSRPFPDPIPRV